MSSNSPHSLWPGYSDEVYQEKYNLLNKIGEDDTLLNVNTEIDSKIRIILTILKWDTAHFGFNCYKIRITNSENLKSIEKDVIEKIKNRLVLFFTQNKVRFVFADVDSTDFNVNNLLQNLGFNFILNWIDGFIESKNVSENISESTKYNQISTEDVHFYADLTKKHYYKSGRFYLDKNFEKTKVDELYESLIYNSVNKQNIIITDSLNEVKNGLVICKEMGTFEYLNNIDVVSLRFLIVNPESRGARIGEKLLKKAIVNMKEKYNLITTGIETHNLISLNIHRKLGFKFNYSHNAYHFWNKEVK
jgi:RimJ/RimL family protein N-acetyltransferase